MKRIGKRGIFTLAALCLLAAARTGRAGAEEERSIDLAICLDTSGSMSGLINSARTKLWQIVSELATAKPRPHLRVALLTYGTPSYGAEGGWVRLNLDLTDDLDRVYQQLMALGTNGGTEYVARVTRRAVESLSWDRRRDTYRVIFVAGNESADQDPALRNEDVCREAVLRGVIVNTIYCDNGGGDAEGYRRVARLAEGRFAAIDQNRGTVTVATPYDKKLAELSAELNGTYVAYGARAREAAANQRAQDRNAASMGAPVAAERAAAKASSMYRNYSWDLVDARKEEGFELEEVAEEELPENMRKMTEEERAAYLDGMAKRRAELQAEIKEVSAERRAYVEAEMKKRSLSDAAAFDRAVRESVRAQAEEKGFEFGE
jgi:hypothetical protein